MNSKAVFLKWVRQNHPPVYAAAVRKAVQKNTLGGLGDDLISDVSVDTSSYQVPDSVNNAIDAASTSSSSASDWSGLLDSIAGAVTTVAPAIVQTQAQLATIQTNQQRAAAGLPPIGSTSLLTGSGLSSTSGLVLAGIAGVGLILLLSMKKSAA